MLWCWYRFLRVSALATCDNQLFTFEAAVKYRRGDASWVCVSTYRGSGPLAF